MFRKRLPFTQLAFVTMLGVAGGIYIYRPYFETVPKTSGEQIQDKPKKENELDWTSSRRQEAAGLEAKQKDKITMDEVILIPAVCDYKFTE